MKTNEFIEIIEGCDELQVYYKNKRGIYQRPIDFAAITSWRNGIFDLLIRLHTLAYPKYQYPKFSTDKAIKGINDSFDECQRFIKKEKNEFLKDTEVFILYHAKLYTINKIDIIQLGNKKNAVVEFTSLLKW